MRNPLRLASLRAMSHAQRLRFALSFSALIALLIFAVSASAKTSADAHHAKKKVKKSGYAKVRGIYWGANIGPQLTGEEAPYGASAMPAFDREAGKNISIDHMGWPFATCSGDYCAQFPFPRVGAQDIRRAGAIPLISFQTGGFGGSYDSWFTLKAIAAGQWDSYFRKDAEEAKRWGHPFFLRFDWEMNGNWFPWGVGAEGNTSQDFVNAWRHVFDIFKQVGAKNVTWVWCPNVAYPAAGGLQALKALYPGNAYVDWTCLDGYNTGDTNGSQFESWSQIYQGSYNEITKKLAPHKPMIVGEFGSSSLGGSKAAWIANALAVVPKHFPKIRALVYWDRDQTADGVNYALETSSTVIDAFKVGISNPVYVANRYGDLKGGIIAPPTAYVRR